MLGGYDFAISFLLLSQCIAILSMVSLLIKHIPIFLTIGFTVLSQCIIKWQMSLSSNVVPEELLPKLLHLTTLLINPWIMAAMFLTFCSGMSWMLAMSRFDLGYAYGFVGLNFVFVLIAGVVFFNEPILLSRIVGVLLIAIGVPLAARL